MGSSPSSQPSLPDISPAIVRQNRGKFAHRKENYRKMLKQDPVIQAIYKKEHPEESGISGLRMSQQQSYAEGEEPQEIEYTEDFFKRFDDVETVKKILFTVDEKLTDKLSEKMDEEEFRKISDSFPIKLYIAEPPDEVKEQAPAFGMQVKLAVNQKFVGLFGLAHAALQIGDKMVHFLDNHFVKIDQFKASQALLLTNMSRGGRLPKRDDVKNVIAEVIVDWNKNSLYDKALRNCQDFVEEMCAAINKKCQLKEDEKLGLSFEHNKLLRDYLDLLVKHPEKSGFHIQLGAELVEFRTHNELDQWEEQNRDSLSQIQMEFLKGFHRAFQLRHAAAVLANNFSLSKRYEANPHAGCTRGNATLL